MTNKDIETIIEGECPSCKQITTFKYIGTQITEVPEIPDFNLYDCIKCKSTLDEKSIRGYNSNKK